VIVNIAVIIFLMVLLVVLVTTLTGSGTYGLTGIAPVVVMMGMGTWYRYSPSYLRRMVQKHYRGSQGVLGERSIQITPEHTHQKTIYIETIAQWPAIIDIVDERNYILMLLTQASYMNGYFIPKRAFATPDQANLFLRTARAYWKGEAPPAEASPGQEATVWPPPPQIGR
jgi:hypothetical protein